MISPNTLEAKTIMLFLNINHLLETDDRQARVSFLQLMHLHKKNAQKGPFSNLEIKTSSPP